VTFAARTSLPDREIPASGLATLNGLLAVVVPCPEVQADSLIFTQIMVAGGTPGLVWVSAISPGVSFTVVSVALNTSVISWMIL